MLARQRRKTLRSPDIVRPSYHGAPRPNLKLRNKLKRYLSAILAVALMSGLAACGGGAQQTGSATTSSPTQTAHPVPDVVGKAWDVGFTSLVDAGFRTVVIGKDGKKWVSGVVPDKLLTIVSLKPSAGQVSDSGEVEVTVNMTEAEFTAASKVAVDATNAKIDAAALATRYDFTCGTDYSNQIHYHSYKDIWTSAYYKGGDSCSVNIDGKDMNDHVPLLPSEQAIVDVVASHGGDVSLPSSTYGTVLLLCAKLDAGYSDQQVARMDWKKAEAAGALTLCPDAPHAAVLQEVVNSVKVAEGTHTVGKDMEPGTYQTRPGAKDCYWSRTDGSGNIIANDMVGFAPNGVTVTVYVGEGFESERCGTWTKVG